MQLSQALLVYLLRVSQAFLHNGRHKALCKAASAMSNKTDIQRNKLMHLENTLVMYGVYNAETLEKLIKTVHALHSRQTM